MKIHSKIRQEVLALLRTHFTEIAYFYNGRPAFIDIEEQQLAVAVYLDEMTCQSITVCGEQWHSQLHITIFLKSIDEAENELDDWAEKIRTVIDQHATFTHLDDIALSQYQYEQDQNQRTWFTATLIFDVNYPNDQPLTGE